MNPTIKIATDVLSDPAAPSRIQVVYRKNLVNSNLKESEFHCIYSSCQFFFFFFTGDGQKLALDSDKMKISNILQVVNKHAKKLEEIEQAKSW